MVPLLALIVFLGVYPKPVLDRIEPSVQRVLNRMEVQVERYDQPVTQDGSKLDPVVAAEPRPRAPASTPPRRRRRRRCPMIAGPLLAQVAADRRSRQSPVAAGDGIVHLPGPSVDWPGAAALLILLVGGAVAAHGLLAAPGAGRPMGFYATFTVVVGAGRRHRRPPLWARVQGWDTLLWWDITPDRPGAVQHRRRRGRASTASRLFITVIICARWSSGRPARRRLPAS